jgi:XTP/dITP diphosphohydrolase
MELVLATQNPGKLRELQALARAMPELHLILAPEGFDPEETGNTFIENALIKAIEAARQTGIMSVADDSGLCVDALDGRPGIHSARYALGSDADRRQKLLAEMAEIPEGKRQAAFVCAMALVDGSESVLFTCQARWGGHLGLVEQGSNGFGYDPIFYPDGLTQTSAEIETAFKNEVSHRSQAWRQVLNFLAGEKSSI